MNPIVLIPARMASSRLPGKPLADIAGTPMIVRVWRQAVAAAIGPVLVAAAEPEIALAIEAARAAGVILRRDFHRSGGPRGSGRHADADDEAQLAIAARLLPFDQSWGWRAEESEPHYRPPTVSPAHLWLVDPNDGTDSYLRGLRGSSVGISLDRKSVV